MKILILTLFLLSLVVVMPNAFANEVGILQFHNNIDNGDGTFTMTTHDPYFELESGEFVPYRLTENDSMIQIEFYDGKFVFDKIEGAVTTFDSDGNVVIASDSYVVRQAEIGSDIWNNLEVNNSPITTTVTEEDNELGLDDNFPNNNVFVTFTRENNEGIFQVEYSIYNANLKTTAFFTNNFYPDSKFAFTQTLELPDSVITLNDLEDIDLENYIGQTFPREVLEQNEDLILEIKELKYYSGIGFDNLWSVGIFDNNKIALDYANIEETQTDIGETTELDPSSTWSRNQEYKGRPHTPAAKILHSSPITATSVSSVTYTMAPSQSNGSMLTAKGSSGTSNQQLIFHDVKMNGENDPGSGWYSGVGSYVGGFSGTMNGYFPGNGGSGNFICNTGVYAISNQWYGHPSYGGNSQGSCSFSPSSGSSSETYFKNNLANGYTFFGIGGTHQTSGANMYTYATTNTMGTSLRVSYTYVAPNPPSAPQSLSIDTQDVANEITLNWLAPSSNGGASVTAYKVYLGGSLIATTGNVLTYDDTISGAEIGASLSYTVKAVNSAGDSVDSNTATVTSWNVPSQVTGLSGTAGTAPSLSWSAPSSEASITNYKIYRQGSLHDTIGNTTSYSDSTNVSSGSTYSYTVSAVSGVGEGAQSSSVNVVAGVPPDPPTNISATIANTATAPLDITVTWTTPTNVGTGTLSGFEIFRDGSSVGTVGLTNTFANTVPSSGTYAYTVKATSNHGSSSSSSADSITTPSAPSQPTLTVTVLSDTSMRLDWTASNENSSTLQGYKIEFSYDNSLWSNYVSNTGNTAVTRTATSLNVDDQYYWRVSGINGVGAGTPSSVQNAWTLLSAPTNLSATSVSESQINLSWTGISGISSYTIQFESPTGNGFSNLATGVSSGDTTYSHTSLTTGTQYNYKIFGVSSNSGSNSVASNEDSANTFGILPAPVLDTLTSVTINPATVQLDWTASTGNPTATGYKIERNLGSGFIVIESDTASVSTTYTDSATTTMNEPIYRVSSINSYGTSSPSNELTLVVVSGGGQGGGGGGSSSSSQQTTTIDDLLNVSILGNTHIMTVGEFITGKIPVSWDSGDNLRISDVDYDDSILGSIKFNIEESTPIILQGSGNSFSSGDITYTISTPNDICNNNIRNNCLVETIYELPVSITSVSNGDSISQTTLITIDTSAGFGGQTLALLSIFIMAIIAGVGIIKFARKSGGKRKSVKSSNGKKKARKSIK